MTPDPASLIREDLAPDADQCAIVVNAFVDSLQASGDTLDADAVWRAEATR